VGGPAVTDHLEVLTEAARAAARRRLVELTADFVAPPLADALADAVLEEVLPLSEGLRLYSSDQPGTGSVPWKVYNALHKRALRSGHSRAEALRRAADLADPEEPVVSWFGVYGPQVAAWLNGLADQEEKRSAG